MIVNYPHYDQVGSLRAISDSSGAIIKQIDYDSFGNVISDTNTSMTVPFGFAGGLHDYDTGLVRFGFRDYDPVIGRWTAKDPIDFAGGDVNLFGYVDSDPVNWFDPLGLQAVPIPVPIPLPPLYIPGYPYQDLSGPFSRWWEDHYNPNWAADTYEMLVGLPVNYWFSKCSDAGRGDPHGDAGRELERVNKRIDELQKQLADLNKSGGPKKDKKKIKDLIRNLRKAAQKAAKGITHWR
jgi:RHS repeat-associated protein